MTIIEPEPLIERALLVPRWAGTADSDFYPWLARELAARTSLALDVAPLLPEPARPEIGACLDAIAAQDLARTVLIGHSVGCQVLLRHLAQAPGTARAPALLCVAGWWTVDRVWDSLRPWVETPFDRARAAARCARVTVLLSDDDPFTTDAGETRRQFVDAFDAEVEIVPGRRHFNAAEEPAVLTALLRLVAGATPKLR